MNDLDITELSILVVEPSDMQLKLIQNHLKKEGVVQITGASNGDEALLEMRKYEPDLVASSMYLPDMNATDLLANMRKDGNLEHIPFMLISSETRYEQLDPIRQAGVVAILPKPFTHEDILQGLQSTMQHLDTNELQLENYEVEELRVLVVDDSATARKHIIRILNNMGIQQISTAENGKEAIRVFTEQEFDVIMTDFNMPEMDGQELIEYIRNDMGDSYTPILMVTSEHDESRLAKINRAGVSAILDKPFDPGNIKKLIFNALSETV